jgi:hypothetical protein
MKWLQKSSCRKREDYYGYEKLYFIPNFVIPRLAGDLFKYFLDSPVKPGNDIDGGLWIPLA